MFQQTLKQLDGCKAGLALNTFKALLYENAEEVKSAKYSLQYFLTSFFFSFLCMNRYIYKDTFPVIQLLRL